MVAGIAAAAIVPNILPDITALYGFPLILVFSAMGCILGSLLTPPDDKEVLKNFYRLVRPWGFWKPIHDLVVQEYPEAKANNSFTRDVFNVIVGMVWHTALTATGIYLVLQDYNSLMITIGVIAITSTILKFNWYDKLEDYPADLESEIRNQPAEG